MPRKLLNLACLLVAFVGTISVAPKVCATPPGDELLGEYAMTEDGASATSTLRIARENERLVIYHRDDSTQPWKPLVDDAGKPVVEHLLTSEDVGEGKALTKPLSTGESGILLEGQGVFMHYPKNYRFDNDFVPQTGYLLIGAQNVIEWKKIK